MWIFIRHIFQVYPLCYFDFSKCKIPEMLKELFLEEIGHIDTSVNAENNGIESSDAENFSEDDEFFLGMS